MELLVVVLIIGILAAVALPQYQRVVVKARVAKYIPLINALGQAQNVYYLANADYASDPAKELDVMIPEECRASTSKTLFRCKDLALLTVASTIDFAYCPGYNTGFWSNCYGNADFVLSISSSPSANSDKMTCLVHDNSSLGKYICDSLSLN